MGMGKTVLFAAVAMLAALGATASASGADAKSCTAELQRMIDGASANGGGRVNVPKGDHFVRCLILKSGVELHLESGARLIGSRNPDDYIVDLSGTSCSERVLQRRYNAIIRIIGGRDISIVGEPGSEIYGRNCYDAAGEEGYRGPHAITAFAATNLVLRGCTVRAAGNYSFYARDCSNVTVVDMAVHGGHDGLDFFCCRNVLVEKSRLFSGDDCVAGYGNVGLVVRDCEVNTSCSLFRVGGTGVLVENCHGSAPGVNPHRWWLTPEEKRLETTPAGAGRHNTLSVFTHFSNKSVSVPSSNVVFRNCRFSGVDRVVHYNMSGNELWQNGKGLADLTFDNVVVEDALLPLAAYGAHETPLRLTARNCVFTFRKPVAALVRGAYVCEIDFDNVTVKGVEGTAMLNWGGGEPKLKFKSVEGVPARANAAVGQFECDPI